MLVRVCMCMFFHTLTSLKQRPSLLMINIASQVHIVRLGLFNSPLFGLHFFVMESIIWSLTLFPIYTSEFP